MGPTEGDIQPNVENTESAPVLVTRLFRSFPAFVEEYASRVALSGAFITAVEPLPVKTTVHLDFQLRDGFRLFHGVGEVVWVRAPSLGPNLPSGMGVRFSALDEKGRNLMLRMLEEHVKTGGQPFDLEPLPTGASTYIQAELRPKEQIDGDDTLGSGVESEATPVAPTMTSIEPPVSEIIEVSFARLAPTNTKTSELAEDPVWPDSAEIVDTDPAIELGNSESFELPDTIDLVEEVQLPELLTDETETVAQTETEEPTTEAFDGPAGLVTDDGFDPPWKSELPDIPEEFLAAEETVEDAELAAIVEAAEVASHVELPVEREPDSGSPSVSLFDESLPPDPNEKVLPNEEVLPNETVRLSPEMTSSDALSSAGDTPVMPTVDFGLPTDTREPSESPAEGFGGHGVSIATEDEAPALPDPGIALPTIPPAEPQRTLGVQPSSEAVDGTVDHADSVPDSVPDSNPLDETGSAMLKPSPWPARIAITLLAALVAAGAFWLLRERARERALQNPAPQSVSAPATAPGPSTEPTQPAASTVPVDQASEEDSTVAAVPPAASEPRPATEPPPKQPTESPPQAASTPAVRLPPATLVTAINLQETDNGTLLSIKLNGDMPMDRVTVSELRGPPPRILVKTRGIEAPYAETLIAVDGSAIRRIRTGYHPFPHGNELHIVIDLRSDQAGLVGEVLTGTSSQLELMIAER